MAATFWHANLQVEDMELMRDFYTRVIGLEETTDRVYEDSDSPSPAPGARQVRGLKEWAAVSWDVKVQELSYRDEDHDLCLALQRFNTPPEKLIKSAMSLPDGWPRNWNEGPTTSPFGWGHLGFFVDDLASVLQRMREGQLGKIIRTSGPDDAPNHAFIYDPEGNPVELALRQLSD